MVGSNISQIGEVLVLIANNVHVLAENADYAETKKQKDNINTL